MKVSDLEGALLDYWVARTGNWPRPRVDDGLCWIDVPSCDGDPAAALDAAFSPSTDWEIGGPILARMIESGEFCIWEYDGVVTVSSHDPEGLSCKTPADEGVKAARGDAPTLLMAAMRAYVASKFGEEVEDASVSAGGV